MLARNASETRGHVQDDLSVRRFDRWEEIPRDEGRAGDVGNDRVDEVGRFEVKRKISPAVLRARCSGRVEQKKGSVPNANKTCRGEVETN